MNIARTCADRIRRLYHTKSNASPGPYLPAFLRRPGLLDILVVIRVYIRYPEPVSTGFSARRVPPIQIPHTPAFATSKSSQIPQTALRISIHILQLLIRFLRIYLDYIHSVDRFAS